MKETILLTGATGFLGSNLLFKLIEDEYQVIILKRSFSNCSRIDRILEQVVSYDIDKIELNQVFLDNHIDYIVHCATSYGRKEEPVNLIESNLIFPVQLLQLAKQRGVSCFINTDTILDKRVNYYSLSKKQFKEWCEVYSNDFVCVNIALEHFYGPSDDDTKFVSYIINNLIRNVPKIDLTEGLQERDFIYIDDVISAFMLIIKNIESLETNFQHYEISTNNFMTIKDFVEQAKKIAQSDTELNFGAIPYRENEVMKFDINTEAIRKLLWEPKTSISMGLHKTIDFERNKQKL
jgi:CDP-paratose synthetase